MSGGAAGRGRRGGPPDDAPRGRDHHSGPPGDGPGVPAGGDEAPHVLPIEDHIDLHPFAPRDVPGVVRDYLEAAAAAGFREVRLIHGKGIGAQRERVRALLAAHPDVESFADAPAALGHWGATLVRLRPPRA